MAENRLRFSQRLNEMSEELSTLAKEVDKNRKQVSQQFRSAFCNLNAVTDEGAGNTL